MEQEHCPNCGTPGRPGAKFCAKCGYEYASPGEAEVAAANGPPVGPKANDGQPAEAGTGDDSVGWPSPPQPSEPFFATGWDQGSATTPNAAADSSDKPVADEATLWQDIAAKSWPTSPVQTPVDPEAAIPSRQVGRPEDVQLTGLGQTDVSALANAEVLLEELRRTIEQLAQRPEHHLDGVISDLEVAVTPPGAMPPEKVAELREALLAAREKPRDVDTIVDLTKRVEAMVSLAIAYDRAIAAIERSLAVLRNESDGVSG